MEAKAAAKAVYQGKRALVSTALLALGVAFELISKSDPKIMEEVSDFKDGFVLCLGVLPAGPEIYVLKEGGRLKYLGKKERAADLKILFKNMDAAVKLLIGLMPAHTAFAQHRAIVHGSLYDAMQANRAMAVVQKYLFPSLMLNYLFKRPAKFTGRELMIKAMIYATLTPFLAINAMK